MLYVFSRTALPLLSQIFVIVRGIHQSISITGKYVELFHAVNIYCIAILHLFCCA